MAAAGKISKREGWENAFCGVEPLTSHSGSSCSLQAGPGNPALSGINPPLSPTMPHTIPAEKGKGLLSLAVLTVGTSSTAGALLESSEMNFSPFVHLL